MWHTKKNNGRLRCAGTHRTTDVGISKLHKNKTAKTKKPNSSWFPHASKRQRYSHRAPREGGSSSPSGPSRRQTDPFREVNHYGRSSFGPPIRIGKQTQNNRMKDA
jgi:hypothetical protein